jgi:undecaprenyl-diphosphatase
MSDLIKAALLGIVEGITEFLPVSSTGHLILFNQFITFEPEFTRKFDVVIQLGAILAVALLYRKRLFPPVDGMTAFFKSDALGLWKKTIVGVFPALVAGALFHTRIEAALFNPLVVSIALAAGGIAILLLERSRNRERIQSVSSLDYMTALFIGLIQCLALIPGTSRSAATIIGAMLLGCTRVVAVEFSFFLAIPTMVAASAFSLFKMGLSLTATQTGALATGFAASFIVAWIVVSAFINYVSKRDFKPFGYYRIVLAGIVLIYFYILR